MESKTVRPLGITILGTLQVIAGPVFMLASFAAPNAPAGAVTFGLGLFELLLGIGMLRIRPWARNTAIVLYALNVVAGIGQANAVVILVASCVLVYLFTPKVRSAFAAHTLTSAPAPAPNV